jgi:hypothetical protein
VKLRKIEKITQGRASKMILKEKCVREREQKREE